MEGALNAIGPGVDEGLVGIREQAPCTLTLHSNGENSGTLGTSMSTQRCGQRTIMSFSMRVSFPSILMGTPPRTLCWQDCTSTSS